MTRHIITIITFLLFSSAAGAEQVNLKQGQQLKLQNGNYLTTRNGLITLTEKTGIKKQFPPGSTIDKQPSGRVVILGANRQAIWGTGGTTRTHGELGQKSSDPQPDIPGNTGFDDPLLKPKLNRFDDPLLKPKAFDDPLFKPTPKKFEDPVFKDKPGT